MNYIQFTVTLKDLTMGDNVETFIFKDIPLLGVGKKVAHLCNLVKVFTSLQEGTLTERTATNEEREFIRELKDMDVNTDLSVMYLIDMYIYKHNLPRVLCREFYEVEI